MTIMEKINRLKRFITHDLWFLDIEKGVSGARKVLFKELQMGLLVIKLAQKNFLFSRASSLAFTTLLSLIPVLAILFMFFKAFGGKLVETRIKPLVYEYLTAGIGDDINRYLDTFLGSATVDTLGSIGFVFLLIAVYSILSSIESSFNAIWQVNKNRAPMEMLKTYLTLVFVTPVLMVVSIWLASRIQLIASIGNPVWMSIFSFVFFNFAPFVLVALVFLFLIKVMPNTQVKASSAMVGSLFGAICYTALKLLFITYTKLAVGYNVIYGSIAILPFFMLWIYFSWIIVLLSVQIVFVRQNVAGLTHIEKNEVYNRMDHMAMATLIMIQIVRSFLDSKEPLSQQELSEALDIPLMDIRESISHLEKSGLIIEVSKKTNAYVLNFPLDKLSIGRIADAVDRMYLESRNLKQSAKFSELSRIMDHQRLCVDENTLLTSVMDA